MRDLYIILSVQNEVLFVGSIAESPSTSARKGEKERISYHGDGAPISMPKVHKFYANVFIAKGHYPIVA